MLDLIAIALQNNGISFARLDSKMINVRRKSEIEKFGSEKTCIVFLASLGSAGVGYANFS
jgi:SNF2 family DNA or RNA helicase